MRYLQLSDINYYASGWMEILDTARMTPLPFGGFSVLFDHKKDQYKSNKKHSISNYSQKINSNKVHYNFLLNKYPVNNDTIPAIISAVNTTILYDGSIPGNTGDTIAAPNQNTEKSIRKSAITENRTESAFSPLITLT